MNMQVIKLTSVLILLMAVVSGWRWIIHQQERLSVLQETNVRLAQQLEIQQARLNNLLARKEILEAALSARQQKQQQLEKTYEEYRRQLGHAVEKAPCASQSVPDDVIRLQRNALRTDTGTR